MITLLNEQDKAKCPIDHHLGAYCVGDATSYVLRFKTNNVLYIYSKGRGSYKRCKLEKYGFPRKPASRLKYIYGLYSLSDN
ncbi:MAG: hypothetical protein ACLFMM_08275 [Methanohalobium sp.]